MVEDEPEIARLVAGLLTREGFAIETVGTGEAMDAAMSRMRPDLIILDLMLPGEDGLTICRRIRETDDVPILMLTAKSDEIDRVVGLEMGADDYLTKPFGSREAFGARAGAFRDARRRREGGGSIAALPLTVSLSISMRAAWSFRMAESR